MRLGMGLLLMSVLAGCASKPVGPEWIHNPTREVDNGYIVYIGKGESSTAERSQFKAEGMALEDLANECSMIPKGTRIEDRYDEKDKYTDTAYVKVAVEFQECDAARKTLEPSEIKKIANVAFTEQLKRYQDLIETGEVPDRSEVASIEPPAEPSPMPERSGWSESTHFYVQRQYVAYQKEIVVLSPPTAYPTGSVASQKFVQTVQPTSEQINNIETKDPAVRKTAWSGIADRPRSIRPAALAPKSVAAKPVHPMTAPSPYRGKGKGQGKHGGHGRHKRRPPPEQK